MEIIHGSYNIRSRKEILNIEELDQINLGRSGVFGGDFRN
jgi:hypothetical protein